MTAPNVAPALRDPAAVLADLRSAAETLKLVIQRQQRWGTSASLVFDLDALGESIRRSATDLRRYLGGAA